MKPNIYAILRDCIEVGVQQGIYRAMTHTDSPELGAVGDAIEAAILDEIHRFFEFDETGG